MKKYAGGFQDTIFKDILTEEQLTKLDLNDHQIKAVLYENKFGKISNQKYQELCSVSKAMSTCDLTEILDNFQLFEKQGKTGAGTVCFLKRAQSAHKEIITGLFGVCKKSL